MLAKSQSEPRRRGVVLVLVLAMLGLLALVGVTFATFSGQARVNNRNYQQSLLQPQADELLDFGIAQLISDTADIRSAIRGHSLARDMYGQGTASNGYLPLDPTTGQSFYITGIAAISGTANAYTITTNIAQNDPNFYGYNFTRWIMRVGYAGPLTVTGTAAVSGTGTVYQTFEIISDSNFSATPTDPRSFSVFITSPDAGLSSILPANGGEPTALTNVTPALPNYPGGFTTQLPGAYLYAAAQNGTNLGPVPTAFPFQLDGRWLHAFNGPGIGATSSAITGVSNAVYGNFRYNGILNPPPPNGSYTNFGPDTVGMDEDYDACDLENWFLAIQSADGQVMIPSFHRPANIRYDPTNTNAPVNDWARANMDNPDGSSNWAASASRILRPVAADGNDITTFPDLVPSATTGQVTFDVDNDGDGTNDSVWLDLGYPARPDASGRLYKPLFAFMVIGLNGKIPLNTAGNLAGSLTGTPGGPTHAEHLGNSVSEVDPTYALQNAFAGPGASGDADPFNTVNSGATWPPSITAGASTYTTYNTQVDNTTYATSVTGGTDVRLTQLRNLLAGTRPQSNPFSPDTTGNVNGDTNSVYGNWTGTNGVAYCMPNGIADASDNAIYAPTPGIPPMYVQRTTSPVPGRWGEAQSIPGVPFNNPNGPPQFNWVQSNYINPVRAGYSFDIADLMTSITNGTANGDTTSFPRDAADDNYNSFDPYPIGHTGEIGDADFYDAAGANLLPVERMRRWVTPADINGTGRVVQWNVAAATSGGSIGRGAYRGADNFGRVQFSSYYRPAGSAGVINVTYSYSGGTQAPITGNTLGTISYPVAPSTSPPPYYFDPYYGAGPNPINATGTAGVFTTNPTPPNPVPALTPTGTSYSSSDTVADYLSDMTNNPFHGYEAYKIPNLFQNPGGTLGANYNPQSMGGMPIDQGTLYTTNPGLSTNLPTGPSPTLDFTPPTSGGASTSPNVPASFPTYDYSVNQTDRSDGLNEADETNLYTPNPLLDSPFGAGDIEWLYRQQDVDGSTLSSRLSQLAPISFTNTVDGLRRRRLFALDSWETNNFVWANDNPQGAFTNNARFTATQSAGFSQAGTNLGTVVGTPTLAQRDKKINLNYPLPVSNDCNEPIRQKWINDTYYLLKAILPPDSVDTAEELAQLSQFVINIVDFRDPDSTMTHWVNPDVILNPPAAATTPPTLTLSVGSGTLDQYGMEYNPVAINETLAYSFQSKAGSSTATVNRFFIELVNTLPAAYNPGYDYSATPTNPTNNYYGNASAISLGGFNYTSNDPYSGGCWDLVFTADTPASRPDPFRGEIVYNTLGPNVYALIPLNRDAFGAANTAAPNQGDVTLLPVSPSATTPTTTPITTPTTQPAGAPPINYFYVIGDPPSTGNVESNQPTTTTNGPALPSVTQNLAAGYDPVPSTAPSSNAPPFPASGWHPGILPVPAGTTQTGPPGYYGAGIPPATPSGTGTPQATYYWVCLRRPANPFAPVSLDNPMCVVDSMRFAYIDGTGTTQTTDSTTTPSTPMTTGNYNTIYSTQRLQPFRGGHAVPAPNATTTPTTTQPPDPRYGYTDQVAVPQSAVLKNYGIYGTYPTTSPTKFNPATNVMYNTLGAPNDSAENWDYFVFNDRDFTSVAELTLVPGCPPGLFTKQFCEVAPSQISALNIFAQVTPVNTPNFSVAGASAPSGTSSNAQGGNLPTAAPLSPFATATAPYLSISQATPATNAVLATSATGGTAGTAQPPSTGNLSAPAFTSTPALIQPTTGITSPVQPHTFPYLVDKFFYTGASSFLYPPTQLATDPSSVAGNYVVGGPAADGWFKMFDFFEVPSQMIGAVGPVASGNNFDWFRQDIKPGLININLIIDEEVFFSVFGRQDTSLDQTELNSIELPLLQVNGALPYSLPLSVSNNNLPPIPAGGPPVPMVVSAVTATGAPNYVYPVTNQFQTVEHGFLLYNDPISLAINSASGTPSPDNRIKAAFAQFLWLRHGGSGYIFGYGSGATGQNSAVYTPALSSGTSPLGYAGALPAERYFHSLSYPDINYTVMRPAALPPSTISLPAMLPDPNSTNPAVVAVANAQALLYQPTSAPTTGWYFSNGGGIPYYYAPYITPSTGSSPVSTTFLTPFSNLDTPVVYTGDPGVRNPLLSIGYTSSSGPAVYSVSPAPNTVPLGVPLPVNVAFPSKTPDTPTLDSVVMPPPIPPRRLFQPVDGYGSVTNSGFSSTFLASVYTGTTTLPPPMSNASDAGDPWINNQIPNPVTQPLSPTGPLYGLNNGFSNLAWTGGTLYNPSTATLPVSVPLPPTGALPSASASYPPYSQGSVLSTLPNSLTFITNSAGTGTAPGAVSNIYLGTGTGGTSNTDDRQHPYWRSETLQKVMNLTTVRTHQYAVWITIGFFQVKRQGDLGMFATNPQMAFDIMGPEVGAANGKNTRYRAFYLIDRLKLTGFNPATTSNFRAAVVYSNRIQ